MAPLATDFYATLKALGCVPCPHCDGSYMLPDHAEHRPLCDGPSTPPDVEQWEAETRAALDRVAEVDAAETVAAADEAAES